MVCSLPRDLSSGENRLKWTSRTLGSFWIQRLFVNLYHFSHLWHVGLSSPSNTLVKRLKQACSCTCTDLDGIGRQVPERVEGDGDVAAHGTSQSRPQLPHEQIDEFGVLQCRKSLQASIDF